MKPHLVSYLILKKLFYFFLHEFYLIKCLVKFYFTKNNTTLCVVICKNTNLIKPIKPKDFRHKCEIINFYYHNFLEMSTVHLVCNHK